MNTVNINSKIDSMNQINISADAEIMQNYQGAYPVSAEHRISAVQDSEGNPMVFALSDDGHFYLMLNDKESPTGWSQIDLSTALPALPTNYAVGQLTNGNITVAVSVPATTDPADTTENVMICGPLSNDTSQTPLSDLSPFWIDAGNPSPGSSVQDIFVGPVDATDQYGIPFLTVSIKNETNTGITDYVLQPSVTSAVNWTWDDFPTPTDKEEMLDYAMGCIDDMGKGIYMLYTNSAQEPTLIFKTFDVGHGSFVRSLTAPENASCLQTAEINNQSTTALFVGGNQGITYFSPDNQEKNAVGDAIASADFISDVRANGMEVRQDTSGSGVIAIWALSGENLMYFSNYADEPEKWTQPVTFLSGVAQFTAIRNTQKQGNELVYISTDLVQHPAVKYMWQDPTTTKWQKEEIPLSDTGQTYQYNCFTTTLAFTDENNCALTNFPVNIAASYWSRITVNGVAHIADTDVQIPAQTDAMGNLSIINTTTDFACPIFTISAADKVPAFEGNLTVNPVYKAYEKLAAVEGADDIPDYLFATNGFPDGFTKDDVADVVSQLAALQPNGDTMQNNCIVYHSGATAKATSRKKVKSGKLPSGFTLSLRTGQAGYYKHTANSAPTSTATMRVAGTIWDDTVDFFGDLWQFAENMIEEVTDIVLTVVEDVVKFTIYLVEETIEIILETIEDVLKAIWYVFKALAVLFVDLIKWLGFIFDLRDIWTMHKVLSNLMTDGVNYFADIATTNIDEWKDDVQVGFANLKTSFANLILPPAIADTLVYDTSNASMAANPLANFNTIGTNWSFYQFFHGGGVTGTVSDDDSSFNIDDHPALQIVNDSIIPVIKDVEKMITDIQKEILHLFQGNPSMNDFMLVVNDFVDTILDAIEGIVLVCLDGLEDFLSLFQSILTGTIHIPFFTALYEFLTGLFGEEEDLNLANVISLIAAFPVTTVYKLLLEVSPFVNGTCGLDQPGAFNTLINGNASAKNAVPSGASARNTASTMQKLYQAIGGFATAIISPFTGCLNLYSLGLSKKHRDELDENLKAKLKSRINYMTSLGIVLYLGKTAASYPIPLGKNTTGDTLSYFNYGLTLFTATTPLIAMGSPRFAAGFGGLFSLGQFLLAMIIDICDEENVVKYGQDCCTCLGTAVNDVGIIQEGDDGIGAIFRAVGLGVLCIGDFILCGRVVTNAFTDQDLIRIQNG